MTQLLRMTQTHKFPLQVIPLEFAEEYAAYLAQGGQPLLTYEEEYEGGGGEDGNEEARNVDEEPIAVNLDTDQDSARGNNVGYRMMTCTIIIIPLIVMSIAYDTLQENQGFAPIFTPFLCLD